MSCILAVHSQYSVSKLNKEKDLTIVKVRIKNPDGTTRPDLRLHFNEKRPIYVAKPKYRSAISREWIETSKCVRYDVSQAKALKLMKSVIKDDPNIARAWSLKAVGNNPNVYWSDVDVASVLIARYRERYGNPDILPEVAYMDYEWDVDDQTCTIGTYSFGNKVHITIRKDMLAMSGYNDVDEFILKLKDGFNDIVKPIVEEYYSRKKVDQIVRDFELKVEVVNHEIDVIRELFKWTHIDKPDYLAFWNGISDLDVIEGVCKRWCVDMHTFMCDPSIPEEFRNTAINHGQAFKLDAKGSRKTAKAERQWHTLTNMASWQFIDLMCVYAVNRAHLPALPSYSFEYVHQLELKLGKLKLVDAVSYDDKKLWHKVMSTKHIFEYALYATVDVVNPMLLEDKNFEIAAQYFPGVGRSNIGQHCSTPRKLTTEAHYNWIKEGYLVGSTPSNMVDALDDGIYDADGMIITLNTLYQDTHKTVACTDVSKPVWYIPNNADGDLTSSYPTNGILTNASRFTTYTEMMNIDKTDSWVGRRAGLSLTSGSQSSIAFCRDIFRLPRLDELMAKVVTDVNYGI